MTIETFDSSTTWTCPDNVEFVKVECWGGGGGASGGGTTLGGGGGGGGGYASKNSYPVIPGNNYTVTVGTGGAGKTGISGTSGTGGQSWFDSISSVLANGGSGIGPSNWWIGASGGSTTGAIGDVKTAGGNGGDGTGGVGPGGGGGGSAGSESDGGNGSGQTGGAAGSGGGASGGGGGDPGLNGNAGNAPGAGGGGGGASGIPTTGGNGANGRVKLTYTVNAGLGGAVVSGTALSGVDAIASGGAVVSGTALSEIEFIASGGAVVSGVSTISGTTEPLIQFVPQFGDYVISQDGDPRVCVVGLRVELDVRIDSVKIFRRDGLLVKENPVLGTRRIIMTGLISGSNYNDIRDKNHEIMGKFKRHAATLTSDVVGPNETGIPSARHRLFIFDDKFIMAYNKEYNWKHSEGASGYEIQWTAIFICDDPFWYSTTVNSENVVTASSPVVINSSEQDYGVSGRSDDVAGILYPVIKTNTAVDWTQLKVESPATGLGDLMHGFFVEVYNGGSSLTGGTAKWTFDMGNILVESDDAGGTDRIDLITADSKFWGLEQPAGVGSFPNPGLCQITFAGGTLDATIYWRPRYF